MEDGITTVKIVGVWMYDTAPGSYLVQFAKQKLPNGKQIPSGYKLWIPTDSVSGIDELLKKMGVDNDFLNKLRFD
jgi:hypothetical protein